MRTVIVRLTGPAGDGRLHGIAEVVGVDEAVPFSDEASLLALLHRVEGGRADDAIPDLNPT